MGGDASRRNGLFGGAPAIYNDEFLEKLAIELMQWTENPTSVWFEAFAFEHKIPADRLVDFAKRNEKFAEAYHYAKQWQKQKLMEGGLLSKFNPSITKLLLSHYYTVRDQQEIKHTGAQPVQVVHYGNNEPSKWESNSQ